MLSTAVKTIEPSVWNDRQIFLGIIILTLMKLRP